MMEHFGDVRNGQMQLHEFGNIVEAQWRWAFSPIDGIETDVFVVMPNHVHGIVVVTGGSRGSCDKASLTVLRPRSRGPAGGIFWQ